MWLVYALGASVLWGISYAGAGRILSRGVSPLVLLTVSSLFAGITGILALLAGGRLSSAGNEIFKTGSDSWWLACAIVSSALGSFFIFSAIGAKNAAIASFLEISYPFFVAIFTWLFFREAPLTPATLAGGLLIFVGVGIVYFANR
jgi:drug/metabolite transporter (DMT)-like permease